MHVFHDTPQLPRPALIDARLVAWAGVGVRATNAAAAPKRAPPGAPLATRLPLARREARLEALARGDVPFATAAIALERTVGPATTL